MGSSVEAHVFEEVGEAALVFLFLYGTYFLGDIEIGTVGRKIVFAEIVSQAIIQFADTYIRIDGNRRLLLRESLLEVTAYNQRYNQ